MVKQNKQCYLLHNVSVYDFICTTDVILITLCLHYKKTKTKKILAVFTVEVTVDIFIKPLGI